MRLYVINWFVGYAMKHTKSLCLQVQSLFFLVIVAHDARARFRQFTVGARVMVQEGRDKSVWKPGTILERRGPVYYLVQMDGGQMQRKHVDHIRKVFAPPAVITSEVATGPSC